MLAFAFGLHLHAPKGPQFAEKTMATQQKIVNYYALSGPISRDTAILSLRYPTSRDTFSGKLALPQNGEIPSLGT